MTTHLRRLLTAVMVAAAVVAAATYIGFVRIGQAAPALSTTASVTVPGADCRYVATGTWEAGGGPATFTITNYQTGVIAGVYQTVLADQISGPVTAAHGSWSLGSNNTGGGSGYTYYAVATYSGRQTVSATSPSVVC